MKIRNRIRSDTQYTDVVLYNEFRSDIFGFGFAWLLDQMQLFYIEKCIITSRSSKGQEVIRTSATLSAESDLILYSSWRDKNVISIEIEGTYKNAEVIISIMMSKRTISFSYPRDFLGIENLELKLEKQAKENFNVIKTIDSEIQVWGNYRSARFRCPFYHTPEDGMILGMLAAAVNGAIIRWYTVAQTEFEKSSEHYSILTDRIKVDPIQFGAINNKIQTKQMIMAIYWNKKEITFLCDHEHREIQIWWDKWLAKEIAEYISMFNILTYQTFGIKRAAEMRANTKGNAI